MRESLSPFRVSDPGDMKRSYIIAHRRLLGRGDQSHSGVCGAVPEAEILWLTWLELMVISNLTRADLNFQHELVPRQLEEIVIASGFQLLSLFDS